MSECFVLSEKSVFPCRLTQSQSISLNPLYVMIPCTLSASFAFMLPVATPPNAIVFSYGILKVTDMVSPASVRTRIKDSSEPSEEVLMTSSVSCIAPPAG